MALPTIAVSCGGDTANPTHEDRAVAQEGVHSFAQLDGAAELLGSIEERWISRGADQDLGFAGWGLVASVAGSTEGHLFALDRILGRVVRLDPGTGAVQELIGVPGDGPGEFRNPVGVDVDTEGRLVVIQELRVSVLEQEDTGEWNEVHRITGTPPSIGGCLLGSDVVLRVLSPAVDAPIVILPLDSPSSAQGVRPLEAPSLPEDPLVRAERTSGFVVCSKLREAILVAYHDLPFLHEFSPSDGFLREVRVHPFSADSLALSSVQGLMALRRIRDEPSDRVLGLVELGSGEIVFQVGRLGAADRGVPGAPRRITRTDSYVTAFEPSGPGFGFLQSDLPSFVGAVDGLLIAIRRDSDTSEVVLAAYEY